MHIGSEPNRFERKEPLTDAGFGAKAALDPVNPWFRKRRKNMKVARFVLKIVGAALTFAGAVCLVIGFWDKLTAPLRKKEL